VTVELKAEFAKTNKLAGVGLLYLEADDFNGDCLLNSGVKFPLMKTINNIFEPPKQKEETPDDD